MEYMIDSADLKEIKRINEFYPIAGVTTNPLILSRCGIDVVSAVKGIREIIGDKMLHVQVISEDYKGIVSDATDIHRGLFALPLIIAQNLGRYHYSDYCSSVPMLLLE